MIGSNRWTGCLFVIVILLYTSCGGGGGGGGSIVISSTNVVLENLSGDIDPDNDGTALISYYLTSSVQTTVDIRIEFSVNNGQSYSACTEDTLLKTGGGGKLSEGTAELTAGPAGDEHSFAWDTDAANDLPDQNLNWVLLRIRVVNGGSTQSGYLTVTNDDDDPLVPALSGLEAVAVQGPSNDTLTITFNKPVDSDEAGDLAMYALQNPAGLDLTIPAGSSISYKPITQTTVIKLDGAGDANLQHGTDCTVRVTGIHDLLGQVIPAGIGDEITGTVVGDGDNIPEDQPELQLAYYSGGPVPQAGDFLWLEFDEAMDLDTGNTFNNLDVEFWNGTDTIGTDPVIAVELFDARTVQITLGTAPQFTPGASWINIPNVNNVVTDLAGNKPYLPASPILSDYVKIIYMDLTVPIMDVITLNRIPNILNGKGPAGGKLLSARSGFTIDLEYHDAGGAGVDPDTIVIQCTNSVTHDGSTIPANTDLVPYLNNTSKDGDGASFKVPGKMVFQEGANKLKGRVSDNLGNTGAFKQISFNVTTPTNAMRPFETTVNPSQKWCLVFSRDLYTLSISGDTVINVSHQQVANGTADFHEDLMLFGLNSPSPVVVPGTSSNSNKFMRLEIYDAIKDELHNTIFNSVNVEFTEQNLGNLPNNAPQISYDSFTHSLIAVGGVSDVGALGVAFIDRGNANQDNDVLYNGSFPYNPGLHLGVFLTEIFMAEVNGWSSGLFRLSFDHFIPGRGVPVGEDPDDPAILSEIAGTGPPVSGDAALRRDRILAAIDVLARYIAVVGGHEMGHSMGLSVNGAMPNGLYGGDSVNFPGSSTYHISLTAFPDLYLYPDVNIMIPATSFTSTNAPGTRFNYLNRAYLREKIFYYP